MDHKETSTEPSLLLPVWIEPDRLAGVGDGAVVDALIVVRDAPVDVGVFVFWIEPDRLGVVGCRPEKRSDLRGKFLYRRTGPAAGQERRCHPLVPAGCC